MEKPISLGILGGGQLAYMLAESALKLGISPLIFSQSEIEPVHALNKTSLHAPDIWIAQYTDTEQLSRFFDSCDVVVFENEFLDISLLKKAMKSGDQKKFFPSLDTLALLQDKYEQKLLFKTLNLVTSPFEVLNSVQDIQDYKSSVLKWSRLGYDGKGVWIPDEQKSMSALGEEATYFFKQALERGSRVYVEQKIKFDAELAMVNVCSDDGKLHHYPLVFSKQENGICKQVWGPAEQFGLSKDVELLAQQYSKAVASSLKIKGVFALEFFYNKTGSQEDLLINELAPRVHNSAHYSQDASETSQFENHIRAAMKMSLGSVQSKSLFLMHNLLGVGAFKAYFPNVQFESEYMPRLHWYHKKEAKLGRKMGHLNYQFKYNDELTSVKRHAVEAEKKVWEIQKI